MYNDVVHLNGEVWRYETGIEEGLLKKEAASIARLPSRELLQSSPPTYNVWEGAEWLKVARELGRLIFSNMIGK